MAEGHAPSSTPDFGHVSRIKGILFRQLAFGASIFGIVALAVLLVYVVVDAFGLEEADPIWTLTAVATAVGPIAAVWLYSAGDRGLTKRVLAALIGGVPVTYGLELLLELAGYGIPLLDWSLLYLFAVVIPTTSSAVYVGSQSPIGEVGAGLIGRLIAGTSLGLVLYILFVVFDPARWMLVYTLGVLPWAALTVLRRRRDSTVLDLAPVPVGVIGFVAGVLLSNVLVFYVLEWMLYVWSIALPAAGLAGLSFYRDRGRRAGVLVAAGAFLLPVLGSLVAGSQGVPPRHALLVLVPLTILPGSYVIRRLERPNGRVGLLAPVVLVLGVVVGWGLVTALGLQGPDPWVDGQFMTNAHSSTPSEAGLYPAIVGSVAIITLVAIFSFFFGVGTAVFLEDYASDEGKIGTLVRILQINIANLAAVPSVVYGLLGLGIFANMLGTGYGTVVTAAVTISLLILPITIISAQEAVRAVPDSLRQGAYAMGSTRWQTTKNVVLPEAMPGIFTGTILALGRAIGETAPLIIIGAATTSFSPPAGIWSKTTAMPMQVYAWYSFPQTEFRHGVLAAGIVTLLAVLLVMNGTAIVLRNKYERSDG